METIHQIIQESVSGGFWKFMGYWAIIASILEVPVYVLGFIINLLVRQWNIKKHGYPPIHCNADGYCKDVSKDCKV